MRSSKPPLQVFVELFLVDSMVDFDVGWNREVLLEKCERKMAKYVVSGQNPRIGTGTESGYRYPWSEAKWYRYHQSGTGTQSQKWVGTGSNQSGTGIDASSNPDFLYPCFVKPKFVHR